MIFPVACHPHSNSTYIEFGGEKISASFVGRAFVDNGEFFGYDDESGYLRRTFFYSRSLFNRFLDTNDCEQTEMLRNWYRPWNCYLISKNGFYSRPRYYGAHLSFDLGPV